MDADEHRYALGERVFGRCLVACGFLSAFISVHPRFVPVLFFASVLTAPAQEKPPAKVSWQNDHQLVPVAGGEYKVGAKGHATNPPRTAKLSAYLIADAETTNGQFAKFVEATGHRTDAEKRGSAHIFRYGEREWKWIDTAGACWRHPRGPEGPDAVKDLASHPVTCLSAADAAAYCTWAGGRLPTQAEWEVAARAGCTTLYPWGADFQPDKTNTWNGLTHQKNTKEDGWEFTAPVRSFAPNAWGLHDVIGNVFEFVSDIPPMVKAKKEQPLTSARGGSWWCSAHTCKAYNLVDNGTMPLHGSLPNQGFRLAATAKESEGGQKDSKTTREGRL